MVERKGGCLSEGVSVVWKEQEVCEQESSERVWRSRLLDNAVISMGDVGAYWRLRRGNGVVSTWMK